MYRQEKSLLEAEIVESGVVLFVFGVVVRLS